MGVLATSRNLLSSLRSYIGGDRSRRRVVVNDRASLVEFLNTRACHVSQTSLYGYLRTRAGMRYPELFENDEFLVAVNIAKWHVWAACLSDLAIFAASRLSRDPEANDAEVRRIVTNAVDIIFAETGVPEEAGERFGECHAHLIQRIATVDLSTIDDDEAAFSESPEALVTWAPIVDDLKTLDADIVRNSVRFRWQEVRRQLREGLDARSVLASPRNGDRLENAAAQ